VRDCHHEAGVTFRQARERSVAAFGADARETLLVMMALALVARNKGDYDLARTLGEQVLAATISAAWRS
jgi:hypothetical protein